MPPPHHWPGTQSPDWATRRPCLRPLLQRGHTLCSCPVPFFCIWKKRVVINPEMDVFSMPLAASFFSLGVGGWEGREGVLKVPPPPRPGGWRVGLNPQGRGQLGVATGGGGVCRGGSAGLSCAVMQHPHCGFQQRLKYLRTTRTKTQFCPSIPPSQTHNWERLSAPHRPPGVPRGPPHVHTAPRLFLVISDGARPTGASAPALYMLRRRLIDLSVYVAQGPLVSPHPRPQLWVPLPGGGSAHLQGLPPHRQGRGLRGCVRVRV